MKGFLSNYIIGLIMLGVFSILFISLNRGYNPIHDWASTQITDSASVKTMNILNISWVWLPFVILVSYMVYSISKPSKERESYGV